MTKDQMLEWRGAVPVARRFNDPYFSLEDGLAETAYVFLEGNRLAERLTDGFHIAELGFGTGLSFLSALALWRQLDIPGKLRFTSFEAYPMSRMDLSRALSAFPTLQSAELVEQWPTETLDTGDAVLKIVMGDARDTLPSWQGSADAWFLDGFSPAENPELWEPHLLSQVAKHTRPRGTFATYTAAGAVRRALTDAGFQVTRQKGFGRKRHMTVGHLPGNRQDPSPT